MRGAGCGFARTTCAGTLTPASNTKATCAPAVTNGWNAETSALSPNPRRDWQLEPARFLLLLGHSQSVEFKHTKESPT
jgi:hypothetical protein